ncbi:MAG: major capsid protein [Nitrososphaerota archaeon]
MATGGIFVLITDDGKQDRMLMATALLNKRLLEIERVRSRNPKIKDPTPTIVDIERTHILFVNAHFKPFAAIAYEYSHIAAQSGTARLGAPVQYSIPQFGDFFHDMVLNVKLSSVSADNAAYWTNPVANPARGEELLSYVEFLGQRLLQRVKFTVNSNPLDEYDEHVHNMHNKFFVTPNKQWGWRENVAQENPLKGFLEVNNANGRFGRGAGIREARYFFDGPQTPKPTQPEVELWIPLLFWFNKDPRLSIPSVSIPYGQRFIDITFARADEILQHQHAFNHALDFPGNNPVPTPDILVSELYINNIFVNPEIHDIFIKRIGFNLIRVHRIQSNRVNRSTENQLMNLLKWPIETLYIGLRPTSNVDVTSPSMLYSWHLYSYITKTFVDLCCLQNGYSFSTALPSTNIQADQYTTNFVSFTGLGLDFAAELGVAGTTVLTVNQLNAALTTNGYPPLVGTFVNPNAPTEAEIAAALPGTQCQAYYYKCTPTISTLLIQAHGIPLYRDFPQKFFNSYIPYTYGGHHINTPEDCGALMITFNLYPGSYQPSGHINISRSREFYIQYTSSLIPATVPTADLVVVAIAINFLLISDGSAVLRYST